MSLLLNSDYYFNERILSLSKNGGSCEKYTLKLFLNIMIIPSTTLAKKEPQKYIATTVR